MKIRGNQMDVLMGSLKISFSCSKMFQGPEGDMHGVSAAECAIRSVSTTLSLKIPDTTDNAEGVMGHIYQSIWIYIYIYNFIYI